VAATRLQRSEPLQPATAGQQASGRHLLAARFHADHLRRHFRARFRRDVLFDLEAPQIERRSRGELAREHDGRDCVDRDSFIIIILMALPATRTVVAMKDTSNAD
jgi:hypothetical protein